MQKLERIPHTLSPQEFPNLAAARNFNLGNFGVPNLEKLFDFPNLT